MITPWTIHEADIALYPAWKDGMPFQGPASRGLPEPLLACKTSLSISGSTREALSSGSWTGADPDAGVDYEISVAFPDGAFHDGISRVLSRLSVGGFHILVVRFMDQRSGAWSCFRFFYVTWSSDEASDAGQVMRRGLRLRSTWLQETVGLISEPDLAPKVVGEVDWICGAQRITCLNYDPDTEQWSSLDRNEIGDGTRYVNFSPVEDSATDVAMSAYFPRVVAGSQVAPALQVAAVEWQNIVLLRIGNQDSDLHHGLVTIAGLNVQTLGIVEPLMHVPQSRMLDEPVIVFRYLRRVYATIGHGVFAFPRLLQNTAPPFSHDFPFRLAVPGDPNPDTGQSGLTLLPDGGYLDGTYSYIL